MKNDKFFEEKIKKATSVNDMKYVPEDRTAENIHLQKQRHRRRNSQERVIIVI